MDVALKALMCNFASARPDRVSYVRARASAAKGFKFLLQGSQLDLIIKPYILPGTLPSHAHLPNEDFVHCGDVQCVCVPSEGRVLLPGVVQMVYPGKAVTVGLIQQPKS